jgi:hypothetical protein
MPCSVLKFLRDLQKVNTVRESLYLSPNENEISTKLDSLQSDVTKEFLDLQVHDLESMLKYWSKNLLARHAQERIDNIRVQFTGYLQVIDKEKTIIDVYEQAIVDDSLYRSFVKCIPLSSTVYYTNTCLSIL